MKLEREHILCAAIWVDTGKAEPPRRTYAYPTTGLLFCGFRHADCLVTVYAHDPHGEFTHQRVQGFMTSKGRFVDRVEGKTIALDARQVYEGTGPQLFSEDLY